jgi:TraU protein
VLARRAVGLAHAQSEGGASSWGSGLDIDLTNIFGEGCLDFHVSGICACAETYVCPEVTYWEPRLLIITEQGPARKHHGELGLQYGEVTAYPFPVGAVLDLLGFEALCTSADAQSQTSISSVAAQYSSRGDATVWRQGGLEIVLAEGAAPGATALSAVCAVDSVVSIPYLGGLCMGVWGPLFARTGWLIHGSQVVGSGAAAYRAAHIISWPELLWDRNAVPATDFRANTATDKMNLVAPRLMKCIRPGTAPAAWESGKLSSDGIYAWVYWVKRVCCLQI